MSHYSENPGHCRADAFKYYDNHIGSWYEAFMIDMYDLYHEPLIYTAAAIAIHNALYNTESKTYRLADMVIIILHPYHQHAFPVNVCVNKIKSEIMDWERRHGKRHPARKVDF